MTEVRITMMTATVKRKIKDLKRFEGSMKESAWKE